MKKKETKACEQIMPMHGTSENPEYRNTMETAEFNVGIIKYTFPKQINPNETIVMMYGAPMPGTPWTVDPHSNIEVGPSTYIKDTPREQLLKLLTAIDNLDSKKANLAQILRLKALACDIEEEIGK
jgi:hypothetical protein